MSKLSEYIEKELKRGFSKKRIRDALLDVGYSKKVIEREFEKSREGEFPQHKTPRIPHLGSILLSIFTLIVITGIVLWFSPLLKEKADCSRLAFDERSECYTQKALLEEDITYCSSVTTNSFECFANLAVKKNDISLCHENYDCIVIFGMEKQDSSVCNNVIERKREQCINEIEREVS